MTGLVVRDVTVRSVGQHRTGRPFEVRGGQLRLPDIPGNGLAWDDDAVARYQAARDRSRPGVRR